MEVPEIWGKSWGQLNCHPSSPVGLCLLCPSSDRCIVFSSSCLTQAKQKRDREVEKNNKALRGSRLGDPKEPGRQAVKLRSL